MGGMDFTRPVIADPALGLGRYADGICCGFVLFDAAWSSVGTTFALHGQALTNQFRQGIRLESIRSAAVMGCRNSLDGADRRTR
jgi:hypothetical protein